MRLACRHVEGPQHKKSVKMRRDSEDEVELRRAEVVKQPDVFDLFNYMCEESIRVECHSELETLYLDAELVTITNWHGVWITLTFGSIQMSSIEKELENHLEAVSAIGYCKDLDVSKNSLPGGLQQ